MKRGIERAARRWALALGIAAMGCPVLVHAEGHIVLTDDVGVVHQFKAVPQRIVSLLPSLTETVCALDACGQLVGVDRHANHPASVRRLPKLGGLDDVNVERLVALRPDVVLASTSARSVGRLKALGLTVLVLASQTHDDVHRTLTRLSVMLGRPQDGEAVWQRIQTDLAQARQQVPAHWLGRTVYFEVGGGPYAAGPSSFIGETLTILGLKNSVPETLGPFPKLSPEFVVRASPDLILSTGVSVAQMRDRPGWDVLPAIKRQQVCGFDPATYDLMVRPGPRMGEAALHVAACVRRLQL